MPDFPTRSDLFDVGAQEVASRSDARSPSRRISPEAIRTEGSDINVLLGGTSAMTEEVIRQLSRSIGALFLDTARNEDLDRLVTDRYSTDVVRKAPAPAVGTVAFSRSSGALPAVVLQQGDKVRTPQGIEFELTDAVTIPALSNGPVSGTVRAVLAGTSGNVAATTVTEFVDAPSDPNLVVTNAEPMTGGDDRETDARYRERARDFFRVARRGTLAAIEFGALTVPGVQLATAEEALDASGDPTGTVFVYVADEQGQANAALVSLVTSALLEFRCAGVVPFVIGATPEFVDIRYRLRFETGVDPQIAFSQIRFATLSRVNNTPPNVPLDVSLLLEIARSVPGVIVRDDALVTPTGDVVPSTGAVVRTTLERITQEIA